MYKVKLKVTGVVDTNGYNPVIDGQEYSTKYVQFFETKIEVQAYLLGMRQMCNFYDLKLYEEVGRAYEDDMCGNRQEVPLSCPCWECINNRGTNKP